MGLLTEGGTLLSSITIDDGLLTQALAGVVQQWDTVLPHAHHLLLEGELSGEE